MLIGLPYLTKLKNNIERRFEDSIGIISAGSIFEPRNLPAPESDRFPLYGNDKLEVLLEFYGQETSITVGDLSASTPPDVNASDTRAEWRAFKLVMATEYRGGGMQAMLAALLQNKCASTLYPNIMFLMQVVVTFPVTTATVERSFSDMKQIKTRLRNRILPQSLDHLMRVAIEGPPLNQVNFDEIADIWFRLKENRRILWTIKS